MECDTVEDAKEELLERTHDFDPESPGSGLDSGAPLHSPDTGPHLALLTGQDGDVVPTAQSPAAAKAYWCTGPDYMDQTTYLGSPDIPTCPASEPQQSKSRVRGRLMQASRREADARMEADMLAADMAELNDQLQHTSRSLKRERQHRKLLEKAIAAKDAKILQLQADLQAKAGDARQNQNLRDATDRAERAERAVTELQQQLADFYKPGKLTIHDDLKQTRLNEARRVSSTRPAHAARRLWAPADPWTAKLLSKGRQGSPGTTRGQAFVGARVSGAQPPQAPAADVLLLQGALRQAHDTSQRLLRQRASHGKHARTHPSREQLCSPADTDASTTVTTDDAAASPAVGGSLLTTCEVADDHLARTVSRRRRWHQGSRQSPSRPATASPASLRPPLGVFDSRDTVQREMGTGAGGRHRSTSPSQQMRQLLTEVDSHITHARMLTAPSRSPPASPTPPACPVNITFHGGPGSVSTLGHAVPDPGGTGSPLAHASRGHRLEKASLDVACHGTAGTGVPRHHVMPASGSPQLGHAVGETNEQKSTGRRHRLGSRPRMSASNIIPPQNVAEEALRQARIEYFADVQRIKQKRLQDWGQMFGQVP